MTLVGAKKKVGGRVTVGSVGGPYVKLATFARSDFSSASNTHWAIFCWFRMGAISVQAGNPSAALCEVALGNDTGPNLGYVSRVGMVAALLSEQFAGIEQHFQLVLDTSVTSSWFAGAQALGATEDICLWGRIDPRGTAGLQGSFTVSDIAFLVFDLDHLTGTGVDWLAEQTAAGPLQPQNNLTSPGGWSQWHANVNSPGTIGQLWLHFYALDYAPDRLSSPPAPPWFQFGYVTDGTFGSFVPLFGSSRLGITAYGPTHTQGIQTHYHLGGFAPLVMPNAGAGFAPATRGQDQTFLPTGTTYVGQVKHFSLRLDALSYPRAQRHAAHPGAVSKAFGTLEPVLPFEIVVPEAADYCVIHNSIAGRAGSIPVGFGPWVLAERSNRQLALSELYAMTTIGASPGIGHAGEGLPMFSMIEEALSGAPGTQSESRYEFHIFNRPTNTTGIGAGEQVNDACTVGFYLDDDPDNIPTGPGEPVDPVILVPPREGGALGTLTELPITPDMAVQRATEVPHAEHRSDLGYQRTWPRFWKVRDELRLSWSRLGFDDRETLDEFLKANPIFKWTQPDASTATALAATSLPDWADNGANVFSCSIDVVELTNLDP